MKEFGVDKFYNGNEIVIFSGEKIEFKVFYFIVVDLKKDVIKVVKKCFGVSVVDLGDGVLFVEWYVKMNVLGED